jgi:hypothetical protein
MGGGFPLPLYEAKLYLQTVSGTNNKTRRFPFRPQLQRLEEKTTIHTTEGGRKETK